MPSIDRASTGDMQGPPWWREADPAQQQAWARLDRELAAELGLDLPYAAGPRIGQCPGSGGYGHGLTAVAVHGGRCCASWDAARNRALAEGRGEPTEIGRLMATDRPATQLAIARARLAAAQAAGAYPRQIEQLEMRVRAREAAVTAARLADAGRGIEAGA